jgi:hypothetical protein
MEDASQANSEAQVQNNRLSLEDAFTEKMPRNT